MKKYNRFIVVDDDPFSDLVCKHVILKFDDKACIEQFTEPDKALERVKYGFEEDNETMHTMLLLDINMPCMNGWEFLDEYKTFSDSIHKQISVFMFSSSIDPFDKGKADENIFVKGYFSKTLSLDTTSRIAGQA